MSNPRLENLASELLSNIPSGFENELRQCIKWGKSFASESDVQQANKIISDIKILVSQLNAFPLPVLAAAVQDYRPASISEAASVSAVSLLISSKSNSAVANTIEKMMGSFSKSKSIPPPMPEALSGSEITELEEELDELSSESPSSPSSVNISPD